MIGLSESEYSRVRGPREVLSNLSHLSTNLYLILRTRFQLMLPVANHNVVTTVVNENSDGSQDAHRGSPDIPNEPSD